jgi:hemolysin activation/secretion protein
MRAWPGTGLPALLAACTLALPCAHAQLPPGVPLDQLRRPSEVPLPAPEPAQPPPRLKVPEAPPRPHEEPLLSQALRFEARGFRFTGNTVFPTAELQALAAPLVGRSIGNLDLDELRLAITRKYVEAGYINSGAVIPDQDVADGIVTLHVVEGRLSAIALGGAHRYDEDVLRKRIAYGARGPLNVNTLQEHMQVLLQDPLIERIAAELAPGAEPGEAVLRVDVTSAPVWVAGATLSNERSPSVGADQAEAHVLARNLLGRGDTLYLRPAYTDGVRDLVFGASVPVHAAGTALHLRAQRTRSHLVEWPLNELDIVARSRSLELGLSHPLIAAPSRTLSLNGWLARRDTRSFLLGEPSRFAGAPDGRVRVSVLRVGADGVDRSAAHVLAGRLQLSHGLDAFGATVADGGVPDSRFTALLAQLQWVLRVPGSDGYVVLRADAQRANDALPGSEKYALGGVESVRGYRKDLLVRDNGWLASIEYRHLLGHLPWAGGGSDTGPLHAAVFFDTGRAWNRAEPASGQRLASIGPGLRWEPAPGAEVQLYYGKALKSVTTLTRTAQDRGIHFRVGISRPF